MYHSSTLYWKINGTRCSEVVCPDHLGLQLLLLGPGLHNPLLLDVEAAVGQDLLGPLDHRDELLAIPDDDAGVETFRDLGGSGAVGEISLAFAKDNLAEKEPCAISFPLSEGSCSREKLFSTILLRASLEVP